MVAQGKIADGEDKMKILRVEIANFKKLAGIEKFEKENQTDLTQE